MTIRLEGQLYKTDPWIADIFTDILNAVGRRNRYDCTGGLIRMPFDTKGMGIAHSF